MTNYHFAFYSSEKERSQTWGAYLQEGARVHGDTVTLKLGSEFNATPEEMAEFDGGMILGMARAGHRVKDAYLATPNKHFVYFDKGYWQRNIYWRMSIDEWQPLRYFQRFLRAPDRFEALREEIKPQRNSRPEFKVLFAGACQNYSNFCNLGNVNDYNRGVIKELKTWTNRPIHYRPNPSWYTKHHDEYQAIPEAFLSTPAVPFTTELQKTHLVVTHGSSATVAAFQAGIPVMVLGGGICRPVATTEENFKWINDEPYWPKDRSRNQFFYDLAYCQWTVEEYRSGKAWAEMRLALSSLTGTRDNLSLQDIIEQYKIMHASHRYFRGLSIVQYMAKVTRLVISTGSETLLDYGCGKGEQYGKPYNLQEAWEVKKITCYDPGVEKFSAKPTGTFDGVLCCDVMEHVPQDEVQNVLRNVISYANKFVFFVIASAPATKTLPDGRNCHLTVQPEAWWKEQIQQAAKGFEHLHIETIVTAPNEDD